MNLKFTLRIFLSLNKKRALYKTYFKLFPLLSQIKQANLQLQLKDRLYWSILSFQLTFFERDFLYFIMVKTTADILVLKSDYNCVYLNHYSFPAAVMLCNLGMFYLTCFHYLTSADLLLLGLQNQQKILNIHCYWNSKITCFYYSNS